MAGGLVGYTCAGAGGTGQSVFPRKYGSRPGRRRRPQGFSRMPRGPLPAMIADPLRSEFAEDAEMAELLRQFADGLAGTCRELRRGLDDGDTATVRRIGHQLKGAGGGYGYPDLTEAGRRLED